MCAEMHVASRVRLRSQADSTATRHLALSLSNSLSLSLWKKAQSLNLMSTTTRERGAALAPVTDSAAAAIYFSRTDIRLHVTHRYVEHRGSPARISTIQSRLSHDFSDPIFLTLLDEEWS